MHLYPYHAAENGRLLNFSRQKLANELGLDEIVAECHGDFRHFYELYGQESVNFSMILHPKEQTISLNSIDAFASWKILNKLWHLLSGEQQNYDIRQDLANILEIGKQGLKKGKVHVYAASIAKIVKCYKEVSYQEKLLVLSHVQSIFPYLYEHWHSLNQK